MDFVMPLEPSLSNPPTVEELRALHLYLSRPEEMPVAAPPLPVNAAANPLEVFRSIADCEDPLLSVPSTPSPRRVSIDWELIISSLFILPFALAGVAGLVAWLIGIQSP
jgi:hypothetical protein